VLFQVIEMGRGLAHRTGVEAKAFGMLLHAPTFSGEVGWGNLLECLDGGGFGRRVWDEFPGTGAMQNPSGASLLARGAEDAPLGFTEEAFHALIRPRNVWMVIAMKQSWPIAPADLLPMLAEGH